MESSGTSVWNQKRDFGCLWVFSCKVFKGFLLENENFLLMADHLMGPFNVVEMI